jgi:hypothetical protein
VLENGAFPSCCQGLWLNQLFPIHSVRFFDQSLCSIPCPFVFCLSPNAPFSLQQAGNGRATIHTLNARYSNPNPEKSKRIHHRMFRDCGDGFRQAHMNGMAL